MIRARPQTPQSNLDCDWREMCNEACILHVVCFRQMCQDQLLCKWLWIYITVTSSQGRSPRSDLVASFIILFLYQLYFTETGPVNHLWKTALTCVGCCVSAGCPLWEVCCAGACTVLKWRGSAPPSPPPTQHVVPEHVLRMQDQSRQLLGMELSPAHFADATFLHFPGDGFPSMENGAVFSLFFSEDKMGSQVEEGGAWGDAFRSSSAAQLRKACCDGCEEIIVGLEEHLFKINWG